MNEQAALIGFSQLGLAFAGFISIFLVFAKKDGHFSPADALRIRSIIHSSFIVLLGALTPVVLSSYDLSEETLWRASAGVFLAIGLTAAADIARRHIAMTPADKSEVGILHSIVSWGLSIVVTVTMVGLVFGYGSGANYLLALAFVLAIAASNFVTIALQRLL